MSIAMFGGLHIDMAALKKAEHIREGSGWTGELVQSGVATSGQADSFPNDHTSPNKTSPLGDSLCLAPLPLKHTHQEHVKSMDSNTEPPSPRA